MSSSSSSGSLSSRLSTSSTSLSSTFSDVSYSSLAAVPSPSVSPPPAQHHKHSKTHAFFASPFSPPPSPPPTPPPPKVSKTHAFFASPFSPPPPPSSSLPPSQSSSSLSQSKLAQPAPKRSLTASFFASKPPDVPVIIGPSTPPDNTPLLTTTTTTTTPSTGLALPNTFPKPKSRNLTQIPLSRLFPSRYSSDPHQLSQESSSIASHHQHNNHNATHTHTHHSHQKRNKREFLSLDTSHANASHHAQEYHNHIHHNHQYIPPQHPGSPHNLHPTWTLSSPTNSSRSISPITPSSPLSRQLSLPPRSEENGDDDENEIGDGEEAGDDRMDLRVEGKVGMGIDSETETERTPRPSHPESPLSYLLHHHQHQRQSQPPSHYQSESHSQLNLSSPDKDAANESVLPDKIGIHREEDIDESVLSPGSIIRSPPSSASARYSPPTSSSSNHSLPPSPSSSTSYSDPTTVLRLLKPLGQGAFSSVWLARDESALPLAQVARSKVELVRKNSIRLKRNSSIKSRRGGGGGGGSIKRKVSSSRYTANATLDSEEDDDQIKGKHWTPLSRNSSLKSTLSRSDSTRSTRSNKSIASVASLASVGTTESTESDSVGSSRSSSGRSDGRGGVVRGVMRVKLGKGGVCGVRPMMGGAGRDGAGDGRIERGDGKEGETRFRVGLGLGLGLGMGVGMDMELDLGNEGGTSDGCGQEGRLVAVKMTPLPKRYTGGGGRSSAEVEERDRMGVSFIREVEVLKHISHPNITPLLSHLTTKTHHVLVLPYLPGGDLLGLVNSCEAHSNLVESVLKQMFYELCKAVAWMHGVGLVHRDIKLENILLTTAVFASLSSSRNSASEPPSPPTLSTLPTPLIQLTDFGLSRFIDPARPLLTTRCGSEAYAAPELVMSGGRGSVASKPLKEGEDDYGYDARETDAWACGVVLYALVCKKLPFGEGVVGGNAGGGGGGDHGGDEGIRGERAMMGGGGKMERRSWLMRIARGEYTWPDESGVGSVTSKDGELMGVGLVFSEGAKRTVGRLLVRDPSRRARIGEVLKEEEEWLSPVDRGGVDGGVDQVEREADNSNRDNEVGGEGEVEKTPRGERLSDVGPDGVAGVDVDAGSAWPFVKGLRVDDRGGHEVREEEEEEENGRKGGRVGGEEVDEEDGNTADAGEDESMEDEDDEDVDGEEEGWLITEPPADSIVCREVV